MFPHFLQISDTERVATSLQITLADHAKAFRKVLRLPASLRSVCKKQLASVFLFSRAVLPCWRCRSVWVFFPCGLLLGVRGCFGVLGASACAVVASCVFASRLFWCCASLPAWCLRLRVFFLRFLLNLLRVFSSKVKRVRGGRGRFVSLVSSLFWGCPVSFLGVFPLRLRSGRFSAPLALPGLGVFRSPVGSLPVVSSVSCVRSPFVAFRPGPASGASRGFLRLGALGSVPASACPLLVPSFRSRAVAPGVSVPSGSAVGVAPAPRRSFPRVLQLLPVFSAALSRRFCRPRSRSASAPVVSGAVQGSLFA